MPPADAGVTELVGEVHLHQLPGGSHAWTSFLGQSIPVAAATKDSITEIDTAATTEEGPCTLYVAPDCAPACLGTTFCFAPDICQQFPQWTYIDGGPVQVTGSTLVPLIRMWWNAGADAYDSDPAPGGPQLFAGGDKLHIVGGMGDLAFEQDVQAPTAVDLITPDPSTDFHLASGAIEVTWRAESSGSIEILVISQASSGASAQIRCVTTDTGELTVPADLAVALPPPPRQTSFQILRNVVRIAPLARPGAGVFVHAGQTTWMNGAD